MKKFIITFLSAFGGLTILSILCGCGLSSLNTPLFNIGTFGFNPILILTLFTGYFSYKSIK